MCVDACACMFGDCYVLLILQSRVTPVGALQLKWAHSVYSTSVGWGRAVLTVSAAPAHAAWSQQQPHQCAGDRGWSSSHSRERSSWGWASLWKVGKKQQGIGCINQLGADWAWYQELEELTFYLVCLFPRQSLTGCSPALRALCCPLQGHSEHSPRSKPALKLQCVSSNCAHTTSAGSSTPPAASARADQGGTSLPGTSSVCCTSAPGHGGRHWFVPPLSWTSTPRVSVKWKILSCTLIYLEKDMSLNIDSFCNETNTFQTAAGLSYPLKYSCGGVTWNMFPSEILFSFDVCSNACAILSVRLLQTVTCAIYFYNGTSYCWTFKMFFYKQTNKYWESLAWNKENRSWGKTIFIVLGLWNTLQRSDFSV